VPANNILPEARKNALITVIDEALEEVKSSRDVSLLQECRSIFRARVPLHLRAYVAANLALKSSPNLSAKNYSGHGKAKNKTGKAKDNTQIDPKEALENKKLPAQPKAEPKPRNKADKAKRYRGEGLSLFISAGRRQRFFAKTILKILTVDFGIAEEKIGDIRTMDNYSFVTIDPELESAVVSAISGMDWKGRILGINRARKKGEESLEADS